jgi:hypothetical protein
MRRIFQISVFAIWASLCASSLFADVQVKGYKRKDGTYVAPHVRSSPNKTTADNYSTKGNVNPYTGKAGTKPLEPSTRVAPVAPSGSQASSSANTAIGNAVSEQPAASPWQGLKTSMTKAQVASLLGEPQIKIATKWVYARGGTVTFSGDGLMIQYTQPK